MTPLRGVLAASVTPLQDHGSALDEDAFGPLVDFFVREGLDGVLALGTAGEDPPPAGGASPSDRPLSAGVRPPAAGCGALRRADDSGHGRAVASRCGGRGRRRRRHRAAVLPARRAGPVRALPRRGHRVRTAALLRVRVRCDHRVRGRPAVLERLRENASNLVGLKVSDTPFERFARYLLPGLDIFVGPEALIAEGMARGAIGAVSALASALPGHVAGVVRDPTPDGAAALGELVRSWSAFRARQR